MHIIFLPQVGWLGGKGVDFHLWGSKINPKNDMGCGQRWNID